MQLKTHLMAVAALAAVCANGAEKPKPKPVLIKLGNSHNATAFAEKLRAEYPSRIAVRHTFDYDKLRAVSVDVLDAAALDQVMSLHVDEALDKEDLGDVTMFQPEKPSGANSSRPHIAPRNEPDTYTPHVMAQVDKLRNAGWTGKGVRVAVIDTGLDYTRPEFGGCFGTEGCRVSFGADLSEQREKTPSDCNGHGTMVAGIVGARVDHGPLGFSGAAPDAELGIYRVGCDGFVTADVLLKAMLEAQAAGAHVVSMSVLEWGGWATGLLSRAAATLAASGIVVVVAAGNSGREGVFARNDPNAGEGVISVGAVNNEAMPVAAVVAEVRAGAEAKAIDVFPADPPVNRFDKTALDVYAPDLAGGCGPLPDDAPDLRDRITLVGLGPGCGRRAVLNAVSARGGRHVVFSLRYPVNYGFWDPPANISAVGTMRSADADDILAALRADRAVTLAIDAPATGPDGKLQPDYVSAPLEGPSSIGLHSSWGPTWDLEMAPSIVAPGGGVLTTYPRHMGDGSGFTTFGGTSAAAPLVAGIVALLIQARKNTTGALDPATIKSLLVSYAQPLPFFDEGVTPDPHRLAPVPQQGGGLVHAFDAAKAKAIATPAGLSFKDSDSHLSQLMLGIKNVGDTNVTYTLSSRAALTVYTLDVNRRVATSPKMREPLTATADISLSQSSLQVDPGQVGSVGVTASVPENRFESDRLAIWSGWIVVDGTDGSTLSVPYQGMTGSLEEQNVLNTESSIEFYYNDTLTDLSELKLPRPHLNSETLFGFHINSSLGIPEMRAYLVPLLPHDSSEYDQEGREQCVPGNIGQLVTSPPNMKSLPVGISRFKWDGRLGEGYAPEGRYRLEIRTMSSMRNCSTQFDYTAGFSAEISIEYERDPIWAETQNSTSFRRCEKALPYDPCVRETFHIMESDEMFQEQCSKRGGLMDTSLADQKRSRSFAMSLFPLAMFPLGPQCGNTRTHQGRREVEITKETWQLICKQCVLSHDGVVE